MASARVEEALSSSSLFVFGHLLVDPSVKALQSLSPDHWRMLQVFALGTLADLTPQEVASLSPVLLNKLRLLSLVQLASRNHILTYQDLMSTLHLTSTREVEDAVVEAVYKGLLSARLDSKRGLVVVDDWAARDLSQDLPSLISHISSWLLNQKGVVTAAKELVDRASADLVERTAHMDAVATEVARLKAKAEEDAGAGKAPTKTKKVKPTRVSRGK